MRKDRPRIGNAPSLRDDPRARQTQSGGIDATMVAHPFKITNGRLDLSLDPRSPLVKRAHGTLDVNVGAGLEVKTGSPPHLVVKTSDSVVAGDDGALHAQPLVSQVRGLSSIVAGVELLAHKGVASGYASLDATTKVPLSQISKVPALTDLSDVTGKAGSGSSVVMSTSPTIVTPTIADLSNMTHDHTSNAEGGALSLSSLPSIALADLSDVTAKTGAGTVVVMDDTPTIIEPVLDTPSIADFTNATHNHSNNTNGGTLLVSAIAFTATDKVLGRSTSGAGAGEEIACTSAGRALMDDSTAFAQRNTLGLYEAYITSNVTTTSASAGDITGLSFSIGASEVWEFSAHLMTQCSTANGHKWAVNIPASCAIAGSLRGSRASAASVIADDIVADDTLSITLGTGTYTTGGWIDMFCIVTNSTNAGTVQLRFAAAVGGDTITVKGPGSYLRARRIA